MSKKMASVVSLQPHAKEDFTSYLGMVITLGAWSVMFAGLFFIYAGLRLAAPSWPPPGVPKLPSLVPSLATLVLALSSLTAQQALASIRGAKRDRMRALLGATIFLGALFLGIQYTVWSSVHDGGLTMESGTYGSVFYALTYFHAIHVVFGMAGLCWLLARASRYTAHQHRAVRHTTMFWHFVDVVWIVTFVTVFLL
jgi:cytochrome c oxidase subunit III